MSICYSLGAGKFEEGVEALKFKRNTIVLVSSAREYALAKENGLQTLGALGLDPPFAVNFQLVGPDIGENASMPKTASGAIPIVFFDVHTSVDALLGATKFQRFLLYNREAIVLCRFHITPTVLEACQFFAALANNRMILANNPLLAGTSSAAEEGMDSRVPFQFREDYTPPLAFAISKRLQANKRRIAILEASTGGMVASQLLSVPGASAFFISGAIVYTARGAKRILPESVLKASSLMERERNYANYANYLQSKFEYCETVARLMRTEMKADLMLVESGTVGPDFRVPGVDEPFTVVGVAGPNGFYFARHIVLKDKSRDRERNMRDFCRFALETLQLALDAEQQQAKF